jgi:hypothetical protein
MLKYTRGSAALVLVASALLGACSSDNKKGPDSAALGADSTLNRDLALANHDTTVQPALKDVPANAPAAPAPTTSRPRSNTPARTTPRNNPPAPRPSNPAPKTTPSGNTVTTNPGSGSNPAASGGGAAGRLPPGPRSRRMRILASAPTRTRSVITSPLRSRTRSPVPTAPRFPPAPR